MITADQQQQKPVFEKAETKMKTELPEELQEMVDTLTPEQKSALSDILNRLYNGYRETKIDGKAGVGKTYLLMVLAMAIDALTSFNRRVWVTAPTHEAKQVLRQKFPEEATDSIGLSFATYQSALSLQLEWIDGDQVLVKDYNHGGWEPSLTEGDYLIVDESSMLGERDRGFIEEAIGEVPDMQVLYSGDSGQLPAVNDKPGEVLSDFPGPTLTEVVRQSEGSPILDAAHVARAGRRGWRSQVTSHTDGNELRRVRSFDRLVEEAAQAFRESEELYSARAIAFRRARVQELNEAIVGRLYDTDEEWTEGMKAMARDGWSRERTTEDDSSSDYTPIGPHKGDLHTSQMLEVKRCQKTQARVGKCEDQGVEPVELAVWQLEMESAHSEDVVRAPVIAKESEQAYEEALQARRDRAKRRGGGSEWVPYYRLYECLASVQYGYGSTCHASQGASIGQVFIDLPDMYSAPAGDYQVQPLVYVALTRAEESLTLLE